MSPSETINVLFFPGCGTIGQNASRDGESFADVVT
jgi:hypothetical protein